MADNRMPNVVFFLVDDLGQRDVGCYGSRFHETPAIDQMAKEGVRFTNAYSTCHVCSPSRSSIHTGKYPARTNLTEWLGGRPERDYEILHSAEKAMALPEGEQTLGMTLQKYGYRTAFFGKAHLGRKPDSWGFDEFTYGWYGSYHFPFRTRGNGPDGKKGDYLTDRYTDLAVDFMEKNRDRPFYLHMAHFAVHDPIHGRKDLVEKYRKKLAAQPASKSPDYLLEGNPDGPALTKADRELLTKDQSFQTTQQKRVWWVKQKQDNIEFAGMVEAMDQSLGRIRAKLRELGLEKNTIVIFTSDNGGMAASNQYVESNQTVQKLNSRFSTSNLPLRGAKGWNYEGGIRVPLIVHWPGKGLTGITSQTIVTGTDFYPTLLEMLDLPALPEQHMDGKSFVAALRGKELDRGPVYWHFPHYSNHGYQSPGGAIRIGRYKLLEYYEKGTVQLFDLQNDIGERKDLSGKLPQVAARLKQRLHQWRKEVDAKMPQPKTAESRKKAATVDPKKIQRAVDQLAPGWKISHCGGPGMQPGRRAEWKGRKKVLLTHPLSRSVPCILSRKISVPANKKTLLNFSTNNHPQGNWQLAVRIDGKNVLSKAIDDNRWSDHSIDLSRYAGQTILLELENRASGWSFEGGYWSRITLVSQ
ncbi:MAG: sulfatase [Planctomycetota bacterium]|nr:sulfatase [Planctomycetota bacterium]